MARIIDHNNRKYRFMWEHSGENRFNGAFFYSKEIVKNIIPNVETDRNWITINTYGIGLDHSIVFIHNNLDPQIYGWLANYKDLILVCGVPETCQKVSHLGTPLYLPLSIDVENVRSYRTEKTENVAFAGRRPKRRGYRFADNVRILEGLPRTRLLAEMAKFRKVYAVGRTAIEAKCLDCEVLPYDDRYPDPDVWKVLDNKDAAKILQQKLERIEHGK